MRANGDNPGAKSGGWTPVLRPVLVEHLSAKKIKKEWKQQVKY